MAGAMDTAFQLLAVSHNVKFCDERGRPENIGLARCKTQAQNPAHAAAFALLHARPFRPAYS